jgi:hypothetical protein
LSQEATGRSLGVACAAHALVVAVLFADVLFLGRVPYLRDVSTYYYPDYVFAAGALRSGVWPLWNPTADAGAPFLMAYPGDLLLLLVVGARGTLRLSPSLHVWLAMCGATLLARELRWGPRAAWLSGAVYGLSGALLSSLNLLPMAYGAAWAPVVVACYLRCLRLPTARSAALLGAAAAMQLSTLAGEVMIQAALAGLVLTPALPSRRQWRALGVATAAAALLGAPALLGLRALLEGGSRAAGFTPGQALGWSAHPIVLAEMAWPRLLGDPHTMTDLGFWGQPFFPNGYPYLVSLYLGPMVLALAACAGRRGLRLWLLAAFGLAVGLGAHGPLAPVLSAALTHFRTPVKFLVLTTLALALLAGRGLEAALRERRRLATWCLVLPAVMLVAVGLAMAIRPQAALRSAASVWPRLAAPEAAPVVRLWPPALLATGLLGALCAAALRVGRRAGLAPAACVVADLLATNARVDPSAPADFYALRPEVASLVRAASSDGPHRWFTYGVASSPGLTWAPEVLARNSDVWLHYVDRQLLWGRTKTLDGLEGAFDEDRTGWAPRGATLTPAESSPALFGRVQARLRLAGVRWVLSPLPLPPDLAAPRGEARLPEIRQPITLHELRDPLPRAFWVPDCEVAASPDAARERALAPGFDARRSVVLDAAPATAPCGGARSDGASRVLWRRLGPHVVEIDAEGDAGWLVVLEGHHRDWRVEGARVPARPMQANGRYWALPAPGGRVAYRVRYDPPWVTPALALACAGMALSLALGLRTSRKLDTSSSVALASGD